MKRIIPILCVSLFVTVSLYGQVNFTPHIREYDLDGIIFKDLVFRNGTEKVNYRPPQGWSWDGGAGRLTIRPANGQRGEVVMESVAGTTFPPFEKDGLAVYRAILQRSLPPDALNVKIDPEQGTWIQIEGAQDLLVKGTYEHVGESLTKAIFFSTFPTYQLKVTIIAPSYVFEDIQEQVRVSLYSWGHGDRDSLQK